jgi:dihydroorotate dehydrogenase electron transfer subunit
MSPVQERAEILAVAQMGEYTAFTMVAPGIAADARPGQFVAIAVGGPHSAMILRRTFALYGISPAGAYAGTIQIVVAVNGPGTRWLADRVAGEVLDVVGPLGSPFPVREEPEQVEPAVLVGGDYGAAALVPLAKELIAAGAHVEFVVGASTASRLFGELVVRRTVGNVTVVTADGSAGERGRVADVLPLILARSRARIVYAAGPMGMLEEVGVTAAAHGAVAHVAVEAAMGCGIGLCLSCVLPVRDDDGRSRFALACTEGPVFRSDRVRWADVGRVPRDLIGADGMGG